MKTKEFIKRVEELGYEVKLYKNGCAIFKNGIQIASVDTLTCMQFSNYHWEFDKLSDEDKEKLFDLLVEYAKTSIEDREEEKRYYLRHKWVNSKTNNYLHFSEENNFYNLSVYKSFDAWKTQLQFTEKEIEEIKEKFDTDLSDFELIEVEE